MFLILIMVVLLAYANGANDNFKGVASLYGSGTCGYRRALGWATITTMAGSVAIASSFESRANAKSTAAATIAPSICPTT